MCTSASHAQAAIEIHPLPVLGKTCARRYASQQQGLAAHEKLVGIAGVGSAHRQERNTQSTATFA
jgi:hypothetical protein